MAVIRKSLEEMIHHIVAGLKHGEPGRPVFSLILGSGFSVPIIPTPSQMVKDDITWWRYWKDRKVAVPFCDRSQAIANSLTTRDQIAEYERELWKRIHAKSTNAAFSLVDGLPDLSTPEAVGRAYQAIMADGLISNSMRRQYLRDAIARTYPRVNAAHIFLAGILEAQETEEWKRTWGAPFCRTIFTTNFDPLLQRSLQLVNKLYYMSDRPDVLEPPDDDESEAIHLVYTHGSVHRYDLRNTEDQIKDAREKNAPALINYFQRHGVIVIGYSGWFDTTMQALSRCPSFDSNLYWCDIHSTADAEQRLRPEALEILRKTEKHAYYVPIAGADEAMRLLHRELKLGDVPKFILDPVGTAIGQLESIEVPRLTTLTAGGDGAKQDAALMTSLAELRDNTLKRLRIAKSAFDDPAIVQSKTPEGKEDVAKAIAAQLLNNAFVAYSQGKQEYAIDFWSAVIAAPGISAKDRAVAQFNRGFVLGEIGQTEKKVADYTAVIEMVDVPPEQKARALYNRGVVFGNSGETTKEIGDYTAVIEMADAPLDVKAMALNNRGAVFGKSGEATKAIADCETVIEMADAPDDQKAIAYGNRGWRRFIDLDDVRSLVEDSRTAVALAGNNLDVRSNLALGLLLTDEIEPARAEYETILSMNPTMTQIHTAIDDIEDALKKRPEIPEAAVILKRLRSALPPPP